MKSNKNNHYHNLDHSSFLTELGEKAFKQNIPLFTTIELTQDCNLRCSHCYNFDRTKFPKAPRPPSSDPSLTHEEWLKAIDDLMDQGAFYISFTGGEVFLYPKLWELVERVNARNGMVKLKTNGALLTKENVDKLLKLKVASLEVSLYGMSEDTYFEFTNKKDYFKKVSEGLERLKGLPITVILNLILSKLNIHELDQMVEYARTLNFPFNFSDEMTKRYDQTSSSLDLNITEAQYTNLLKGKYAEYFHVKNDLKNHSFQCACARNVCGVGYNGDVFPCIGAPIKVGNIKTDQFSSLWKDSPVFNQIRKVKNEDFKDCIKCDFAEYCNRSSGSAFVNTQNYYGCDPISYRNAQLRKMNEIK